MTGATKRVVTGWSESGEPVVLFSRPPAEVAFGATAASELWRAGGPPDLSRRDDAAAAEWQLEPAPGGSVFRLVAYQPGAEVDLHATETLDYVVVLSGELTLVLPGEELVLRAGDTLVQRGTPHGWANRSGEPCVIAVVLLSAQTEPPR